MEEHKKSYLLDEIFYVMMEMDKLSKLMRRHGDADSNAEMSRHAEELFRASKMLGMWRVEVEL